ncbi:MULTISPECIES: CBS domain-containing protein [Mycobacterium]|nr:MULTISPECIES: CBS domain-containing protein [Mycobacterium]MDM4140938.1 CBS domain-containing protein [Mycobacterium sp. FLAC0960]WSE53555.1 CBS domain-containing protein [Mycobacterium sp. 2-64]
MNVDIVSCETWAYAAARPRRVRAAGWRGVSDRSVANERSDAAVTLMFSDVILVAADADVSDVAVLMADYKLHTIPVDDEAQVLGVVTVDDVLKATIPDGWRRREPGPGPAAKT